ncbi:MAG: hypothetical protein H7641_05420 [Candidatus Heimdallarchaeota archaeon]|nr:hypothetical protein [Candidatus Heimdallarchaeota archaeon]MCK4877001.1 hypothetical protein [Candidatus Heimdallarchaeota archaeon]
MKTNTRDVFLFNVKKATFIILFVILLNYALLSSEAQAEFYINKVTTIGGSGTGYDIEIDGNYAYITGNDGFIVIDIQNPSKPNKISEFDIDDGAFGIFVKDNIAYVAAAGQGLIIADISDPFNPSFLGQEDVEGITNNVYALEDYAYVTNYEYGLQIFDISDLTNPIKIAEYSDHGRADGVVLNNNFAYLANPNSGVNVINVTDPSSPQRIRTLSSTGGATGISIYENLLFVGCYSSQVLVFDITTSSNPIIRGSYYDGDGGEAQGVVGNSTHLFVADNYGVEYFDISNLSSLTKVAEQRAGVSAAHDIDFTGNFLYVAGGSVIGSLVFEVSKSQKSRALGIYVGLPIAIVVASVSSWIIFRLRRKKA